jgi:hypothetical protein
MKRTRQDIESELRSLVPKTPSPRVRDRIAGQLAVSRPPRLRKTAWVWAPLVVAVAASLVLMVRWWPRGDAIPTPGPIPPLVRLPSPPPEVPPPTLLAYQQHLGRSHEALDDLLDRHAASLLTGGSPEDDIGSLSRDLRVN